jgi:predicted alternative tryptophan synthase beta-subunit
MPDGMDPVRQWPERYKYSSPVSLLIDAGIVPLRFTKEHDINEAAVAFPIQSGIVVVV